MGSVQILQVVILYVGLGEGRSKNISNLLEISMVEGKMVLKQFTVKGGDLSIRFRLAIRFLKKEGFSFTVTEREKREGEYLYVSWVPYENVVWEIEYRK